MLEMRRAEFLIHLRALIQKAGSQQEFARSINISSSYLSDVLKGFRQPGPRILIPLGFREEMLYVKEKGR